MKILVLENLIRRTNLLGEMGKTPVSKENLELIFKELETLVMLEYEGGIQSLAEYLKNQNGKELKGGADHVWKYRLNDGDRILYTWGKYLPYIREEDRDSLVLLAFATHDKQGQAGWNMPGSQHYEDAKELLKSRSEFSEEDLENADDYEAFCEIIFAQSYQENHVVFVVNDETLASMDLKYLDFQLSKKQASIIENYRQSPTPLMILGGAGTGKTVLAIHFLNDFSESNKCAYFTQSRELLNSVKNRFAAIHTPNEHDDIVFYDINEFCRSKLDSQKWSRRNFVETTQFMKDFIAANALVVTDLKRYSLTPVDLWTEIRGVIKGGTQFNWTRAKALNQNDYDNQAVRELDRFKLIERTADNRQCFRLVKNYKELAHNLSTGTSSVLRQIEEYVSGFDVNVKCLTLDEYLNLDDQVSMVEKDARKTVYKCYEAYGEWLGKNCLYDDNDLAVATISYMQASPEEKYDFLVVDEIQDYTEVQIYLINMLAREQSGVVFAGDSKQIVNPTVFDERKLYRLFNERLKTEYLSQNFRCQKEVVAVANKIAEISKDKIAARKHEEIEIAHREGEKPIRLAYSKENVSKIVQKLIVFPNVAVLVPNEECRQKLIDLVGADTYKNAGNSIIYTIAEIKGMEYRYVLSFDILSTYNGAWDVIMRGQAKKRTRFRYYFNLFYVSVTRAQQYLCLLEESSQNEFYRSLGDSDLELFNECSEYDIERLFLDKLSNDAVDWLDDAEQNEEAGNYERALESYKKGDAPSECIWRCLAKLAHKNHKFEEYVKYLFLLDEQDSMIDRMEEFTRFVGELKENSELRKLTDLYISPEKFTILDFDLNEGLKAIYGDAEEEYVTALNNFMERINIHLDNL